MKDIIAHFMIVIEIAACVVSCSDDSLSTGPDIPVGAVLFSADSIYFQADSGYTNMVTTSGAWYHKNTAAFSVEVQYRIRTNVNSSADSCFIHIHDTTNGMPQNANVLNLYQPTDTVYKQVFRITEQPYNYFLNADIVVSNRLLTDRYIWLSDIKVIKTQ